MGELKKQDIDTIKLLLRSPDIGDGWRKVSNILWKSVVGEFEHKELLEIDEENKKVRLSHDGKIVAEYLTT